MYIKFRYIFYLRINTQFAIFEDGFFVDFVHYLLLKQFEVMILTNDMKKDLEEAAQLSHYTYHIL